MEPLKPDTQVMLRESCQMQENEVAYSAGDLVIAIDVTTDARRVLGKISKILGENQKRILKG